MKIISITLAALVLSAAALFSQNQNPVQADSIRNAAWADTVHLSAYVKAQAEERGRAVHVITEDEIRNAPVQGLIDLLDYFGFIDARERGNIDVQADISIRGGSGSAPLILLNGMRMNDPLSGVYNLDIPAELEAIKKIEILEGPAAAIYGPYAASGVINIVTGPAGEGSVDIKYGRNGFGYNKYFAAAEFFRPYLNAYGHYSSKSAGSYESGNRRINNTGFSDMKLYLRAIYRDSSLGEFDFQGGYLSKEYGVPNLYVFGGRNFDTLFNNQYEDVSGYYANLKHNSGLNIGKSRLNASPEVYWRRHFTEYQVIKNRNDSIYFPEFDMTDALGGKVSFNLNSSWGSSILTGEYFIENLKSTRFGDTLAERESAPGEDDVYYTRGADRQNFNVRLTHFADVKGFSFTVSGIANWNSLSEWDFATGVDVVYNIYKGLRVYATANQGFRLPDFRELYSSVNLPNSIIITGNPGLASEKIISLEAGLKENGKGYDWSLGAFRNIGKDVIDWTYDVNFPNIRSASNFDVNFTGFSGTGKIKFRELFGQSFIVNYLKLSYQYLTMDEPEMSPSIELFNHQYLQHKLVAGLNHGLFLSGLGAQWQLTWADRIGSYFDPDPSELTLKEFEPQLTVDVRAFYDTPALYAFFEVANLTNEEIFDVTGIPLPGRWMRFGFRYKYPLSL